ncbi:MAG: DUF4179 domain-containing protein [Clostridia bacterium]|nr:DUF4179 domain-containing protein [Clostridia bacterium]
MKRKLSVSFVLVLVTMMLTLSVAFALVQSSIVDELYGSDENAPQDVIDHILTPKETTVTPLGTLSVDEILYDGNALHVAFTVANPTSETLLYTVDGLWLNGSSLDRIGRLTLEGAGSAGVLLGGEVDGVPMPLSESLYNKAAFTHEVDEGGKYAGMQPLPREKATLKVAMAIWRPINAPQLVDYKQFEGVNVTETRNCLVTDENGLSELWLFRPRKYNLTYGPAERASDVYAAAFKEMGWAELVDTVEVELEVDLSAAMIPSAEISQPEYTQDGCRLVISSFELSHAGGMLEGLLFGDDDEILRMLQNGLGLVDRVGNRVLNNGTIWDDELSKDGGYRFTMELGPITGELPQQLYLAPVVDLNIKWDETSNFYDPTQIKPEGVIGVFQFDFSRAFCINLDMNN